MVAMTGDSGRAPAPPFGWGRPASLAAWLEAEPHRFEFVQTLRLLESLQANQVRLRARGEFAFPPSEVCRLTPSRDGEGLEMTVALLALDGAFGPLPSVYAEERIRAERLREPVFSDFLDIFHNRLLRLLYRIACAYRPALGSGREGNPLEDILLAVAGLRFPALRNRSAAPDAAIPRYAALFGRDTRSAHGLERALADYTGLSVKVRQFVGCWAPLNPEQRTRLGQGSASRALGNGAVLGTRVWDEHAGIEVRLGDATRPLARAEWMEFLPGGSRQAAVAGMVRLYVRGEYRFRFRLTLSARSVPPSWLGGARLGYTSFLLTRPSTKAVAVSCPGGESQ